MLAANRNWGPPSRKSWTIGTTCRQQADQRRGSVYRVSIASRWEVLGVGNRWRRNSGAEDPNGRRWRRLSGDGRGRPTGLLIRLLGIDPGDVAAPAAVKVLDQLGRRAAPRAGDREQRIEE